MRFKGKTALIAGGGRNMGKAIALAFAREGADMILVARTASEVKQTAGECEKLGVQALPVTADLGKYEEVAPAVEQALKRFGKVDVLVSCAGIRPHKPVWEYDVDEWHRVFAVNVHSTFYLAKLLAPQMVQRKTGAIVALGGLSSVTVTRKNMTVMTATKHGLLGLIKALAVELGPHGIRANLIAVGSINTERRNPEWYLPGENPHASATEHDKTPLRRGGSIDEIAEVALFLASDASSYVTGDTIYCTGGRYQ